MREKIGLFYGLNVCVPIVTGGIIYYLFYPDILFVDVLDSVIHRGFYFRINSQNFIMQFIRCYLFDALWAYALMFAPMWLMNKEGENCGIIFGSVLLFEIVMEGLQKTSFVGGTFDICDIAVECISNILVILILMWRRKHGKKE